jgi:hypothetical protein
MTCPTSRARHAALVSGDDWDTNPDVTWDQSQGLFLTTSGDLNRHALFVGRPDAAMGLTAPRLFGYDLLKVDF